MFIKIFIDDWNRTTNFWSRKWPLYHLSHIHYSIWSKFLHNSSPLETLLKIPHLFQLSEEEVCREVWKGFATFEKEIQFEEQNFASQMQKNRRR